MMASLRSLFIAGFLILFLFTRSESLVSTETIYTPASKAISDLQDAIVKGLGFRPEELKISGFDTRDALVGQSVAYEFDIQVGNQILPVKLLEDVNRWEFVDLPIFRPEEEKDGGDGKSLAERGRPGGPVLPVLAPFQLAGPMELWIQDGDGMRLSLPHDVDAGVLKKVILAEGAVVTVKGARSVSLRHPLDLPLPLNRTHKSKSNLASGLLTLADHLHLTSLAHPNSPIISLRIVGPSSLTTSSSLSPSKLKLKRLAPGLVELSKFNPNSKFNPTVEPLSETLLTPHRFTTLWPLVSINGSNSNLQGCEDLLHTVLGPKAGKEGSFKLLKADVSAETFMKVGFGVEKGLKEGEVDWSTYPEWRTRPETMKMQFEVLAKIDGEKMIPERITQVPPVEVVDSVADNLLNGNVSMSRLPIVHPPPSVFSL